MIGMRLVLKLMALIFMMSSGHGLAQRLITARVIDETTGKPMKDINVFVEKKQISTTTNAGGFFQLSVDSVDVLTISHEGYKTLRFSLPKENNFKIQMSKAEIEIYKPGMDEFYRFWATNIKYPSEARNKGIQGSLYLTFEIDSLGHAFNVTVLHDIGSGCRKEILRVMNILPPDFIPDRDNSVYVFPIKFKLLNTNSNTRTSDDVLPEGKLLKELVVSGYGMSVPTRN
jgi:CarboxypepD_reg-like domain/Gram-negative bacterial TonB protein C-terminal